MSKLDILQGKALELAGQVGDGIRHSVPSSATTWLRAGMALGAARASARTAGKLARRNPAFTVAAAVAAAGAGLLIYALRHRQQNGDGRSGGTIEGKSKRVDARRAGSTRSSRPRKTASRRSRSTSGSSENSDS